MQGDILVQAQPSCLDPFLGRKLATVEPGLTLDQMVRLLLPGAPPELRPRLRVTVGDRHFKSEYWASVRPRAGTQVLIQAVPGDDDGLRTALNIAVTVGSLALGQFYGPILANSLVFGAGSAGSGLLGSAFSLGISATTALAGNLLINALIPVNSSTSKPTYQIQGLKNQATPNGVVPLVLGRVRAAPPLAMLPITEAIADQNYATTALLVGYGPVSMRNWRIGETPIERYGDVILETRQGRADDGRLTLTPQTVIQRAEAIELKTSVVPTGGPQIRTTAADAASCSIDITFPNGVWASNKNGSYVPFTVDIQFRYRRAGDDAAPWQPSPLLSVTSKKMMPITRSVSIIFPERGRYEIEATRLTIDWDETDQGKKEIRRSGRSIWSALRSYRPEYPIVFEKPLALAACKIRATGQLQGVLDELNGEFCSICPDWDAASGTWIERETNNPASLFRWLLTGPAAAYPLSPAEVGALEEWHAFCVAKGLHYNRYVAEEITAAELLSEVAAAGRASPHHNGTAWSVVIDRALDIVSAHITPRNSWGFRGERPYTVFPDAFRVSFLDETNGYKPAERVVPWPGFEGDPQVVQRLDMPGITDPAQIWRETRRRQWELVKRLDTFTVSVRQEHIAYGRGDRVEAQHDVLDGAQVSCRVKSVTDDGFIQVDEDISIEAGQAYACRFRRQDGSSLLCSVTAAVGVSSIFKVRPDGGLPKAGDLALFGIATRESMACTVKAVEAMEKFQARVTLIAHAPEIEALIDAEVPPLWSGRAGAEAQPSVGIPKIPLILDIVSGRQSADQRTEANPYPVVVLVQAASGEPLTIVSFDVRSRKLGSGVWMEMSGSAAAGAVLIADYSPADKGAQIEIQARAVAGDGNPGPWTLAATHTIAATDPVGTASPGLSALNLNVLTISGAVHSPNDGDFAYAKLARRVGAGAVYAEASILEPRFYGAPNSDIAVEDALPDLGAYTLWGVAFTGDDVASPPSSPRVLFAPLPGNNALSAPFDIGQPAWFRGNVVSSLVDGAAPDGSAASLVTETTASDYFALNQGAAAVPGSTQRFGIALKAAGRRYALLRLSNGDQSAAVQMRVDLLTGSLAGPAQTYGGAAYAGARMVDFGNGWWLCLLSGFQPADALVSTVYLLDDSLSIAHAGDPSKGVYAWAASLGAV